MTHKRSPAFALGAIFATTILALSAPAGAKSMVEQWLDGELAQAGPKLAYQGKPITVRISTFLGAGNPLTSVWARAVKRLDAEVGGKIRVKIFYGNSLADAQRGAFEAVASGVADVSSCYSFINPGFFDLQLGLRLPFLFESTTVGSHAILQIYPQYFKKKFESNGVLFARSTVTPPNQILSRDRPIKVLEDLKGRKVGGNVQPQFIRALGATPVALTVPEYYTGFQTGVVDTMAMHDAGLKLFRMIELTKFRTLANLSSVPIEYCMNKDFFLGLPRDVREVFHVWLMRLNHAEAEVYFDNVSEIGRRDAAKAGIQTHTLPEKEYARWVAAVQPGIDAWVKEMEGKGLPARQMLSDLKAKVAELAKLSHDALFKKIYTAPYPGLVDY
ncbi:MAG: TRAP transporter substrate-binding protein DctP [Defluviicoccus sp.]|nr:TRAP transporter substrate-binding protein DctP [Defluviicoccus sp.]